MVRPSLLSLLEENDGGFVSGEEISRKLNVTRTAIWKQVRKLEAEGYRIEAVPRMGYRIIERPSRLSMAELQSKLATKVFGRRAHLNDAVPSTQDVLRELAEQGAPEGTLVIAEQQTKGRGRMGRNWVSPAGKGIWMSLLLRPNIPLHQTPQLTLLAAVALSRAIARIVPLEIGIKWPNDLLVDGRKISGILLESAAEDERIRYVVAGMGISVNLEEEDFPPEVLEKAISLRMAAGRPIDRTDIITAVLEEFERLYELYAARGFAPIRALWEAHAVTLGREAILHTPQGEIVGVPEALDELGGLRVKLADGTVRTVYSAEIGDRT
ncbi:biotin--[acetyl-CoA-carboxylase] ligase [Cohnella lubricantis]|uniref:Bifunctional ligase/repressor BirA n=1 Tax=Cohnella lubricantis TaxID=2163172 RepID=A0A841TMD2_9BACL|nr:biotin--[acetyl-CoA-carboxylase] ligase [Cohnella lubricantis]MBB6679681.1 biotin--[acetyl-CoA-carboxylase] ligase [Cohnella lubricantis]MBP2119923.1 BirA family biotin operon repressor/biotin-[acetyl-CoA-carboxylase] ligase [Cohnella lubricantis]